MLFGIYFPFLTAAHLSNAVHDCFIAHPSAQLSELGFPDNWLDILNRPLILSAHPGAPFLQTQRTPQLFPAKGFSALLSVQKKSRSFYHGMPCKSVASPLFYCKSNMILLQPRIFSEEVCTHGKQKRFRWPLPLPCLHRQR